METERGSLIYMDTNSGIATIRFDSEARFYVEGCAWMAWFPNRTPSPTAIGGKVTYPNTNGEMITEHIADVIRRSIDPDDPRWISKRPDFEWIGGSATPSQYRELFGRLVLDEPAPDPTRAVILPTEPGRYTPSPLDPHKCWFFLNADGDWWCHRRGYQTDKFQPQWVQFEIAQIYNGKLYRLNDRMELM